MHYAWALYYKGALVQSRHALAQLDHDPSNLDYRSLHINLGIVLGDWNSLSTLVADDISRRAERSARELLDAARLALQIRSPHARELLFAAAEKGDDDADILATAYVLASQAGWEDDTQVVGWLTKAVKLSDDHGPLRAVSFRDLLEQTREWNHRESEIWSLLGRGEIPMFSAASSLHKSLIDLTLFPAVANLANKDPRRTSLIPAYSGTREPVRMDLASATAGMDATALLTLSYLNLLEKALDAFAMVWLPHSTLAWLFEEKQRAVFHQPSKIKDAHQIRDLLADGVLETFVPSVVPDGDVSIQVGADLAALIAEAEKDRDDHGTQRLVVRPLSGSSAVVIYGRGS